MCRPITGTLAAVIVLVVLMSFTFVSLSAMAAEPVQVTISVGSAQQNTLRALVEKFEQENPDIKVNLLVLPAVSSQQYDRLVPLFTAKDSSVDVLYMDVIWPGTMAAKGWLEPLDRWFTPEMRKDFLPGTVETVHVNGHYYGVPLFTDGGLLYYRKDLLQKYGFKPPVTWDELRRQTSYILAQERNPILQGYIFQGARIEGTVDNYFEILWSLGGQVFNSEGQLALNGPAGRQALEMMYNFIYTDKISSQATSTMVPDDGRIAFMQGRGIFMRNWTFAWASMNTSDSAVRGKVDLAPLPHAPGQQSASCLGGWNLGINAYSRHKEEAWRLVKFLTDFQSQKQMAIHESTLPTRQAVYKDREVLAVNPHFDSLYDTLIGGRSRPLIPQYLKISDVMQSEINAVLANIRKPDEALQRISVNVEAVLR